MALEGGEQDCEIRLVHDSMTFEAVASEVGHYVAKLEGDGPKILFQAKFSGYAHVAADLAEKVRIDPVELTLLPAQMDLGLQKGEGEADVRPADTEEGPALAPAATMGGTHQNVDNRPRRGGEDEPEEDEDFMADMGVPAESVN